MNTDTDTDTIVATLAAKDGVRDALLRYCRGVDRLDEELLRTAYHPDAIDDHGVFVGPADEFIVWILPLLRDNYVSTSHVLSNQLVEVDGDRAWAETYYTAVQVHDRTGVRVEERVTGRYLDDFERRDGEWRILLHRVVVDSQNSSEVRPWAGASDLTSITRGRRDRDDASYDRLGQTGSS